MRLITARTVERFAREHAEAENALADWIACVQVARWETPNDALSSGLSVRTIGDRRLVFRIIGNKYRIICDVQYASRDLAGIIRVQFIGTHAEYDKVDAATVKLAQ
jgi:mRNA interferase HigB